MPLVFMYSLSGESFYQNVKVVTTKSLHRILPHIEQRFYKVAQAEKAGERSLVQLSSCTDSSLYGCLCGEVFVLATGSQISMPLFRTP